MSQSEWKKEFRGKFTQVVFSTDENGFLKQTKFAMTEVESFISDLLAKQRQEVLIGYVSHATMVSQVNAAVKGAYEEAAKVAESNVPHHTVCGMRIAQAIRTLSTESEEK